MEPGPRLTVSDTGAAIAPDRLAALFEQVVQGDRGTSGRAGQRLAITRRSTGLHGGSLEAASAEGKGLQFRADFFAPTSKPDTVSILRPSARTLPLPIGCNEITGIVVCLPGTQVRHRRPWGKIWRVVLQ